MGTKRARQLTEETEVPRMQAFDTALADRGFSEVESFGVWLDKESTQTIWFRNLLLCLISAIVREYRSLRLGYERSTPLLAWGCRNMLELNIYTKYALIGGFRARAFVDDRWIDAIDILKSLRDWARLYDPSAWTTLGEEAIRNFEAEKVKQNVRRTSYLKMHEMASDVGFLEEYKCMVKVASKLVHPTAFSVLGSFDQGEFAELRPILFNAGVRYGLEASSAIRQHVGNNGVEPLS